MTIFLSSVKSICFVDISDELYSICCDFHDISVTLFQELIKRKKKTSTVYCQHLLSCQTQLNTSTKLLKRNKIEQRIIRHSVSYIYKVLPKFEFLVTSTSTNILFKNLHLSSETSDFCQKYWGLCKILIPEFIQKDLMNNKQQP